MVSPDQSKRGSEASENQLADVERPRSRWQFDCSIRSFLGDAEQMLGRPQKNLAVGDRNRRVARLVELVLRKLLVFLWAARNTIVVPF